jgi:CRISPR/Cas system-associated exonuclease Cas4 (RecB family)
MAGTRMLSFSEIDMALQCTAKWDYAYGGRLAGSTLKRRETSPTLQGGRAWGAAVAQWHAHGGDRVASLHAHRALSASLDEDYEQMVARDVDPGLRQRLDLEEHLSAVLDHYMDTVQPFDNFTLIEHEILVPILAVNGKDAWSSRYRYLAKLDGFTIDRDGMQWPVEFKLRESLTPFVLVARSRQPRWYTLALAVEQKFNPFGIIVEETWNRAPQEPKIVKAKRKTEGIEGRVPSTDPRQAVTPEAYSAVCEEYGVEPTRDTLLAFQGIRWTARHPIMLTAVELDEASEELREAAALIGRLDSGTTPIRNAKPMNCRTCQFSPICDQPEDSMFVETMFVRGTPKRLRGTYTTNGATT